MLDVSTWTLGTQMTHRYHWPHSKWEVCLGLWPWVLFCCDPWGLRCSGVVHRCLLPPEWGLKKGRQYPPDWPLAFATSTPPPTGVGGGDGSGVGICNFYVLHFPHSWRSFMTLKFYLLPSAMDMAHVTQYHVQASHSSVFHVTLPSKAQALLSTRVKPWPTDAVCSTRPHAVRPWQMFGGMQKLFYKLTK